MCKAEKRKKNLPHIHLLDDSCGEESQAIKETVQEVLQVEMEGKVDGGPQSLSVEQRTYLYQRKWTLDT